MLINTSSFKVLLISLGGIFSQLILLSMFFILYKFNFVNVDLYKIFIRYNCYIILFNLLPMYPLDGFKILNSLLEIFLSFKKSIKLSLVLSLVCIILFFIYLYLYKISNYVIIVFLLVSLVNYIKEVKYIINKFYIERILYNLEYNGMISVRSINYIYKNRFNYINGINEKKVLKDKFNII